MEQEAFEALIARNEERAARTPRAYRWRVFCLATLGYLYLALVVGLLIGLLGAIVGSLSTLSVVGIKLLIIVGAPLLMILRAMWVKLTPPSGVALTRENSPSLYRMLEDLRRRLKTPRLHRVLLTADFNAGITQVPRLGLLGWYQNYLLIGLPLMKALTVEQFRAVLAHEFGHLSAGHSRVTNRIYRLRIVWQRLNQAFTETRHWGSFLIRPFVKRYIPYFNATSFPLARANEYEADAASVRVTSARSAAQALTSVNVAGAYLTEKYWPAINLAARETPQPSFAPYSAFQAQDIKDVPVEVLKGWQDKALARVTSYADTHPSLADRLRAIGVEAEFAPPSKGEGAETLLGPHRAQWESEFDEHWRTKVAESWKRLHERTQANRVRIAELRAKAAQAELDEPAAIELVNLEEEVGEGSAAALAMRRALMEKYPNSQPLRFALARQLLQAGDSEGVAAMESVMAAEPEAVLLGTQILRDFYARQNQMPIATRWHQKYLERANLVQTGQRERSRWLLSDAVVPHGLASEDLARLVAQLKVITELKRTYLARKLTRHLPDKPLYVLGFRCTPWWKLDDRAKRNALTQQIRQKVKFPGDTLIIALEGPNAKFAAKIRRVKGARIV
jgi:Zn-dependent protease with chaperone function